MRSKLFEESPKNLQTSQGRWVRILPDQGQGYELLDPISGKSIGRILVDKQEYWIYDGSSLNLDEQDEVAGQITGYQNEMNKLVSTVLSV